MAFDNSKTYTGGTAADDAGTVNFFNSFRFQYGTAAARPAAGNQGVLYWSTDTPALSYDTGAAWVDLPVFNSFVEVAPPAATSPTNPNVWEDWDLSATIPAGAKYANILIWSVTTDAKNMGVRANGSAVARYIGLSTDVADNAPHEVVMTVALDANRIVERYVATAGAWGKFTVLSYWS